ncbi:MAG: hypothetical protein AB8H79_21590 [Myxococcota bacterium]
MRTATSRAAAAPLLLLWACTAGSTDPTDSAGPTDSTDVSDDTDLPECPTWGEPRQVGQVSADGLTEISGLAPSRSRDHYWVHNDSGDGPVLYGLQPDGTLVQTVEVDVAAARDWEAMATAGDGSLWIGDIGDNKSVRDKVTLHRITKEPASGESRASGPSYDLTYEGGPRDAEALLVDVDGKVYIIDKQDDGQSTLFWADTDGGVLRAQGPLTLDGGASLVRTVTAGTISDDGSIIVIRTYFSALAFRRTPNLSIAEALAGTPCELGLPLQPQGETLAFLPNSTDLVTISEGNDPVVWQIDRE